MMIEIYEIIRVISKQSLAINNKKLAQKTVVEIC